MLGGGGAPGTAGIPGVCRCWPSPRYVCPDSPGTGLLVPDCVQLPPLWRKSVTNRPAYSVRFARLALELFAPRVCSLCGLCIYRVATNS